MSVHILLGLQWGDEGKGKIVDFLAPNYEVVARFQGGPNAGHTLVFEGNKYVLHQIPSGIFRPDVKNIIGNGLVIDATVLKQEIEKLASQGVDVKQNLYISHKAHLILPTHKLLDTASEQRKGDQKIGSTQRGIGPTYKDKVGRNGIRIGDILLPNFQEKYAQTKASHEEILKEWKFEYNLEEAEKAFLDAVDFLKTLPLADTEYLINDYISQQKSILAEGAQGALLDIDFGSYPFVTSSNTTSAGALTGLGIAPKHIGEVLGIFKAYCTRVGSGPFPTEQDNEIGEKIRQIGMEFGATTGRKRRCGWLDLPALKYAIMINGVSQLLMMKADVLNTFEELLVCTHYELADGTKTDRLPYSLVDTAVKPIYKTFKGWNCSLEGMQTFSQLPKQLAEYVHFIEENVGVPIKLISTGADRNQTILK